MIEFIFKDISRDLSVRVTSDKHFTGNERAALLFVMLSIHSSLPMCVAALTLAAIIPKIKLLVIYPVFLTFVGNSVSSPT